ncbi:MAG TPA: HDOD domain-containing protein, partial [Planctomycetaceae bacterium]|nr:HDOD domain-containing protein [Planctomycetaceae bacterium]
MAVPDTILKSPQLPSLPAVAVRLLELARDPESEIQEVVETIQTDPALTAKILKAANSSYFGFRSKVTSVDRAVPLLGTTVVTSLALGFSLTDQTTPAGPMYEHYHAYWMQSLAQAAAADLLGKHARTAVECEFFLAGLLADIGRLAMLKTIAKEYVPVLEAAKDGLQTLHELEQEHLGYDHIEVGLELMRSWELPDPLLQSAALHHAEAGELQARSEDPHIELLRAVATAAAIGEYFCGYAKGQALQRAKQLTEKFYGFSEDALNEFIEQTSARIEEAGQLFSMNTSSIPDPSELLAQANEQLAQLAMRAHVESQQAKAREKSIEEEKKRLESKNRELQQQAVHDPLTEVYNRRFFDETLSHEIARARREAAPVALLFIDIDHFKRINDTYGHHCGDLVLQR